MCERVCVLAVSLLLKNKPKTIKLYAAPNQYDGKSLLLGLMYFISHTETGLSMKSVPYVCVCVCVTGLFSWPKSRFTARRQHRRTIAAVVLSQNVITEGGKVRLQG